MRRWLKRLALCGFLAGGFLSALLLLLFAAATVRLTWKGDQVVVRPYTKASYMLNSSRWALRFDWMPPDYPQGPQTFGPDLKLVNAPWHFKWTVRRTTGDGMTTHQSPHWWRFGGVQSGEVQWGGDNLHVTFTGILNPARTGWYVYVPLAWGVVFLPWPAACLWWLARRRRLRRTGCCAKCGYDLRGSPGACPECGWGTARVGV